MLSEMKKVKAKPLTDDEKQKIVDSLIHKMENASELDEEDVNNGKPAVHKLALLESVQQAVSMATLHETLLGHDGGRFLSVLKQWISPHEEDDDVLPNVGLRTTVYNMLAWLPCKLEDSNCAELGRVLSKLRNHSRELPANRRLLTAIVEKWSRAFVSTSDALGSRLSPLMNDYGLTIDLEMLGMQDCKFGSKQSCEVSSRKEMLAKRLQQLCKSGKKSNVRAIASCVSGKNIKI
jgi:hypothetical protein